jgi:hypothetical protein
VKTSSIILAATLSTFGLSTFGLSAVAEPMGGPLFADAMPPYEVMNIVRASGFRPLGPPIWRGRIYVVRAIERHGEDVRILVDSNSGRIVSVVPAGPPPGYGAASAYGPGPRDDPEAPYGRPEPYPAGRYASGPYESEPYPPGPYRSGPYQSEQPGPYQPGPYQSGPYPSGPDQSGPYQPGPSRYGATGPLTADRSPYPPPSEPSVPKSTAPIGRSAAVTPPRTPLPRPRPAESAVASPADVKTPEPASQTSQPQAGAGGASQDGGAQAADKPAQKPAEKPATTALPPVAPLD